MAMSTPCFNQVITSIGRPPNNDSAFRIHLSQVMDKIEPISEETHNQTSKREIENRISEIINPVNLPSFSHYVEHLESGNRPKTKREDCEDERGESPSIGEHSIGSILDQ